MSEQKPKPKIVSNAERRAIAFLYALIEMYPKHAERYLQKRMIDKREKMATISS